MRLLKGQKGVSILAVVGLMVLAGIFGMAVVSLVSTSHTLRVGHLTYDQAVFVNQAGFEYAMAKVYEGRNPVTGNRAFGPGLFRVSRSGNVITVLSTVGESQVVHQATQPPMASCLEIDTSQSHTHRNGTELARVWLTKRCLDEVALDKMILSWEPDNGETFDQVRLSGVRNSTLYRSPPRIASGSLVELIDSPMERNQRYKLTDIRFADYSRRGVRPDMRLKDSFDMKFFFADGSEKEVHFTLGPCRHDSC